MPKPAPIVDQAVANSPGLGLLGLALVVAALGLIILGTHTAASLLRGLDQGAVDQLSTERPQAE